jgi:hypothetical protein
MQHDYDGAHSGRDRDNARRVQSIALVCDFTRDQRAACGVGNHDTKFFFAAQCWISKLITGANGEVACYTNGAIDDDVATMTEIVDA